MTKYLFAYYLEKTPGSDQQKAELMEQWNQWMQKLGPALVEPGAPVGQSYFISSEGVTEHSGGKPLCGYSLLEAESVEQAMQAAQSCPHLQVGTIEMAPLVAMDC